MPATSSKVKKTDKLAKVMAALQPAENQYTSDNGKEQKTTEFYMEVLKRHQEELGKQRLTVWMQVGSFFEVYGFKWPDGRTLGNVWDVAADLDIKIARKKMLVMNDPTIEVYMAGVKEEYADPYLERLVDQHGWTVAIYVQEKMAAGVDEFKRVLKTIISPGINFESDSISNVLMYIYFRATTSRFTNIGGVSLNCGVYYADCINGNNGVQELNCGNIHEPSVLFSELVKLITIRNPAEVIVHCDFGGPTGTTASATEYKQFTDAELSNSLGLHGRTCRFIRTPPQDKYRQKPIQAAILGKAFADYQGRGCILEELGMAEQMEFGRLALVLALEYIFQHDTTILTLLERPEIHRSSGQYLMLANNCLQQLDIIDPTANTRVSQMSRDSELVADNQINNTRRKISLLDLLDKTKSVIGRRLFRQRLSTPITDPVELQARYELIGQVINIHTGYLAKPGAAEQINTPFARIRHSLGQIRDIPKFMRKIATNKLVPTDIELFAGSLQSAAELDSLVVELGIKLPTAAQLTTTERQQLLALHQSLPAIFNYQVCAGHWSMIADNIFQAGVSKQADDTARAIALDRDFVAKLTAELTKLIIQQQTLADLTGPSDSSGWVASKKPTKKKAAQLTTTVQNTTMETTADEKPNEYIKTDSNTRLGTYLYLNDKNKELLDAVPKRTLITIGSYQIPMSDIRFEFLRKNAWQIRTEYLHLSSKNLSAGVEILRRILKQEFQEWQQKFYRANHGLVNRVCGFVGETDVCQAAAYVASRYGYTRPQLATLTQSELSQHPAEQKSFLRAKELRHPIVEQIHRKTRYVSNNLEFGIPGQDGMLLFGVNASGKSTTMKAVGCALVMAQAGFWVPASEFVYSPYSYLFTRIRNNDDIYAGLSSFEVEMREFKVILKYANQNSMILGDELCSGTETLDATAIVASGLKLLAQRRANFIFATHLHFLSEIPEVFTLSNLKFYHLAVHIDPKDPSVLVYDRELRPGNGPQSYGIIVCRSMNLDLEFIREAERIRLGIERGDILGRFSGRLQSPGSALSTSTLAPQKQSHFNAEKLVDVCEVCGAGGQLDVHHIDNQCSADKLGIITDPATHGKYHKNNTWNLVNLCKECHHQAHGTSHTGQLLVLTGYTETSQGAKLGFRHEPAPRQSINLAQPSNLVQQHDQQPPPYSPLPQPGTILKKKVEPVNEIRDAVLGQHTAGKTLKAIQHYLRTTYQQKHSLREIDSIINSKC
jgi:DNA mismatch repair protein MutS